ncbi:hypothetical protein [Gordonia sp. 'Campus']|uniref:TPR repeat region-containing protein n=1 Tax=Gordonia sp. 'Campus' TaxID=2915824 RepID=UPI001EE4A5DE|nr:hypothetical protein [Gordonia sp. 'Campus']
MTPTYDQVMGWKPESLGDIASAARTLQTDLDAQAPKAGDPVINLTTAEWKGLARTAADGRAESITRWLRSLSDQYGSLATALDNGKTAIRGAMTTLENQKSTAAALGYELRTDDPAYNVDFEKATAPDGAKYDKDTATELQQALLDLGRAADTAVSDTNSAVSAALGAIAGLTPASIAQNSSTIDPTKAAPDAQAILSGTATPEQRARFERAMQLTPEQLARLQLGQPVDISPEQFLYIKHATGAVDVGNGSLSGIKAFEQFGGVPAMAGTRGALANGLQILSNKNIHAGGLQGGFEALPQTVKDVLSIENPVVIRDNVIAVNGLANSATVGNLLHSGDSRYQAGTEIDRRLGELGRKYTDAMAKYEQEYYGQKIANGFHIDGEVRYDANFTTSGTAHPEIQEILKAVGRDKMWVSDAFAGPDGADFIHDLMTAQWDDNGRAAGTLLTVSESEARSQSFDIPPEQRTLGQELDHRTAERSATIMEAIARYTGSHDGYNALMDIPGMVDGKSAGEVNPELLRTLADSFTPYTSELGGHQDRSLPGFNDTLDSNLIHTPGTDNFEGSSRIFGLLATDEEAAKTFYGQVYADIASEVQTYADNPAAGDADLRLKLISHLRGLADEGLLYAATDRAGDEFAAAKSAYELKSKILDDVFKVTDLGTGKVTDGVPGSDILLDHGKDALKQTLLGEAPSSSSEDFSPSKYKAQFDGATGENSTAVNDLLIAITEATEGDVRSQVDPDLAEELEILDFFNSDGTLRSREEIVQAGNVSEEDYLGKIRTIIEQRAGVNSNPDNIPKDYQRVWTESEELGTKWTTLNLP